MAVAGGKGSVDSVVGLGRFLISRSPRSLAVAIGLILVGSLTEGFSLLLLLPILKLLDPKNPTRELEFPTGPLAPLLGDKVGLELGTALGFFVLAIIVRSVLMGIKELYSTALLYDFTNQMRNDLFASVTRARWVFLARLRGSDIEHALTADVGRIQGCASMLLQLVQSFVLLAVYGAVALVISPTMTLFAGGVGLLVVVAMTPIRRLAISFGRTLTGYGREQYRVVNEFLGGVKVAKAFNAEPLYAVQLAEALDATQVAVVRYMKILAASRISFQVLTAAGLALFVYMAVTNYEIDYSIIVALVFLFIRLAPRVTGIQTVWQSILTNVSALEAVSNLQVYCDENAEVQSDGRDAPRLVEGIAFRGVDFSYISSDRPILAGVDFVIPANKITAIVGPSGTGKSTIADLLMGLLEPTGGAIVVDGVPLPMEQKRAWRGTLGYVPQETFLLHDTLAANLAFGRSGIDEPAMWEALRLANAEHVVRALPDTLQTVVGDRGIRLSGGERQRIALARALLCRPRLLLLDEATSSLDWESQAAIARAIDGLRGRMTVVTIAHRPSMIAFADWVVAIDAGKVVEAGEYRQLASIRGGYFQKILAGDSATTEV